MLMRKCFLFLPFKHSLSLSDLNKSLTTLSSKKPIQHNIMAELHLSHEVHSGSDITPSIKIDDKPLVVYIFSNVTL